MTTPASISKTAKPPLQQGTVGLWWLSFITLGIYFLVWYQRVNNELAELLGEARQANGAWWSQILPIYGFIGLHATAVRVNRVIDGAGTNQKHVGTVQIWLWRPFWFFTPHTCIQKRMNGLHHALAAAERERNVAAAGREASAL